MDDTNEILVGVNVVDEAMYAQYRALMTPLLEAHGGRFILDVQVAKVLRAPSEAEFNRLFTIRFASGRELDAFFAHTDYLAIRERWFDPSVAAVTRFARYAT